VIVRPSIAALLASVVALFPIAPQEHVHETTEHGEVTLVVHRHAEPHGILPAPPAQRSRFDDDDGPVVGLTALHAIPASPFVALPPIRRAALVSLPAPRVRFRPVANVEILIHGPPRAPTPPRAPPFAFPA
jgi:hypothetical protein